VSPDNSVASDRLQIATVSRSFEMMWRAFRRNMNTYDPGADDVHNGLLEAAYRRLLRSQAGGDLMQFTAIALGVFALTGLLPLFGGSAGWALFAGMVVAILWCGAAVAALTRRAQRREDIALLVAAQDSRVAAPLLEELRFHRSRFEGAEGDAVRRVLRGVTPDDPLFRYQWHQEALHYALLEARDPAVLESVLLAVGRVGDGRGIGQVRMLAENAGHFVRDEGVAKAARSVLPVLRIRARISPIEPGPPPLLRSALFPSTDPGYLLHAEPPRTENEWLVQPSFSQDQSKE
jgi:hypothetical protein